MRNRLIELISHVQYMGGLEGKLADHLLAEGVIVPPCKVGDTLYVISQMKDKRILPFINEYEVTSIWLKKKSIVIYHEMDGFIKIFRQTDFGKTVFLTREEAEEALKGASDGKAE